MSCLEGGKNHDEIKISFLGLLFLFVDAVTVITHQILELLKILQEGILNHACKYCSENHVTCNYIESQILRENR